jgi:glycosyltransferase involved in cell wall biosynthesis
LYGNGELEKEMTTLISELNLNQNITMKKSGDLSDVLSVSTCYVSTQDFENFPSLSMMEAMACGNIILARNVGQTELMVKDGYNGLILKEDSPRGLANAIESVINYAEDTRNEMMRNSLNMIENVHTPIAFINQIETFWEELLAKKKEIL